MNDVIHIDLVNDEVHTSPSQYSELAEELFELMTETNSKTIVVTSAPATTDVTLEDIQQTVKHLHETPTDLFITNKGGYAMNRRLIDNFITEPVIPRNYKFDIYKAYEEAAINGIF